MRQWQNLINLISRFKITYLIEQSEQMNNKLSSLHIKKSYSLIQRKQRSPKNQHEQVTHETNPQQSPIEQLIKQKYNFTFRLKPVNPFYKPIKKLSNNNFMNLLHDASVQLPNRSLKVSILPEIDKQQNFRTYVFQNEQIKLHQNQNRKYAQKLKIKLTQRQTEKHSSSFMENYTFVKGPSKRNLNEYKKCMKNIQLNTTYRGFNTQSMSNKESKTPNFKVQSCENDKSEKMNMNISSNQSNINERKRIVSYMIERGFARKMQQSLMKIRKEKKRVHEQSLSSKNSNSNFNSPIINKLKRSVVFTISPTMNNNELQTQIKDQQKKQQSIDPW